jgi:uronate dehydrogenase
MTKIVLTGAAGRLGSYLRQPLAALADELVSTDISTDIGDLYAGERFFQADLADYKAMSALIDGADTIVHFGAIVDEAPFEALLGPNFVGSYNVWEAGFQTGAKRIVYASSIHAVGMYPKNQFIDSEVPHRPDTFYGLAKCFTEDLGRMYFEKRGLESVHLRILSAAQVTIERALGSWLSYDDLIQLVVKSVTAQVTGFAVCYGVSDNDRAPVDNRSASFLGYRPTDNAEQFAEEILAAEPEVNPSDPRYYCHGGPFAAVELGKSGLASMNIVDDKKQS